MNKKSLLTVILFSLLFGACTKTNKPLPLTDSVQEAAPTQDNVITSPETATPTPKAVTPTQQPDQSPEANQQKITMNDVSSHNSKDDCWFVIDGSVYDVTNFIPNHPGGPMILQGCGKDASSLFHGVENHQSEALTLMKNFKIGNLSQ